MLQCLLLKTIIIYQLESKDQLLYKHFKSMTLFPLILGEVVLLLPCPEVETENHKGQVTY